MTARLEKVFSLIDRANSRDPSSTDVAGKPVANELLYGQRMSACLTGFLPGSSEELQIACRAQHLERWKLPRSAYPQTREGYHAWRNEQKRRHAARVTELMLESGYTAAKAERVSSLVRKERIKRDLEAQALEDVACLVFLECYAIEFAAGRDEEQILGIIRKTWRKMSDDGQAAALNLNLDPALSRLVGMAIENARSDK